MKKQIIILIIIFIISLQPSLGARIVVDKGGGGDYHTIHDAVTNATSGDSILVLSGEYVFDVVLGNISVNKQLSILGSGYDIDGTVLYDQPGNGFFTFTGSSDGSKLSGFRMKGSGNHVIVQSGANTIILEKNYFIQTGSNNTYSVYFTETEDDTIRFNYFFSGSSGCGLYVGNTKGQHINNNLFAGTSQGLNVSNSDINDHVFVLNNIFIHCGLYVSYNNYRYPLSVNSVAEIYNNIFMNNTYGINSNGNGIIRYNGFFNNSQNNTVGVDSIVAVDPLFIDYTSTSVFSENSLDDEDFDFHLEGGSPYQGTGMEDVDLGIYGGNSPMNDDFGFLTLPVVQSMSLDETNFNNSNGSLSVLANGRTLSGNIDSGEYFVDSDPGTGSGSSFTINTPASSVSVAEPVSFTSLEDGFHWINLRFHDDSNGWGPSRGSQFYIASTTLPALDISKAEYFFDSDPGENNGTELSITTAESNVTVSGTNINVESGLHLFYIRFYSDQKGWGPTQGTIVFKQDEPGIDDQISGAEYFIDTDPGEGNGFEMTVGSPGTGVSVSASGVDIDPGLHIVYARFYSDQKGWGPTQGTIVFKQDEPGIDDQISGAEYFIDTDPGEGNGFEMTVGSPGTGVSVSASGVDIDPGLHIVYARFYSDQKGWGPAQGTIVFKQDEAGTDDQISGAEYFIDTDPGEGNGVELTVGAGTNIVTVSESNISISDLSLSQGLHRIYFRFYSDKRGWGPAQSKTFYIIKEADDQLYIVAAEYFVDSDPGVGAGESVTGTFTESVEDFEIPLDIGSLGLSAGVHNVGIRAQGSNGFWGPTSQINFFVTDNGEENEVYVQGAEYFVDEDPGRGLGNAIPAPVDGVYDEANEEFDFDIPLANLGLAEGQHIAYFRIQMSNGYWGVARATRFIISEEAQPVIDLAEYFFDTDPGQGNGIILPPEDDFYNSLEESSVLELAISETGLEVGSHKLYVRYRNNRGEWGPSKSTNFSIVVKPMIEISETAFDFGVVFIGDSVQNNFVIKNSGDADLVITDITLPSGYSSSWNSSQGTIIPGDSINVIITFKPNSEATFNGNIVIENNDANKTIYVSGQGSTIPVSKIQIIPTSPYDFGEVDIFTDIIDSVKISIQNSGTAKLWISDITSSDEDIFQHNFVNLSDSIDIGGEVSFNLYFTPNDTLEYFESLNIVNNSPEPNYSYSIYGKGVGTFAPHIIIVNDTIDFGTVQTGNPATKTLHIGNVGTIDLNIANINSTNNDFSTNLSAINNTVAMQDTNTISVYFNPSNAEIYDDSLSIFTNDTPHSPGYVHVLGIGSATPVPNILVSVENIDFGNIHIEDAPISQNIRISNNGTQSLNISAISCTDNVFTTNFSGFETITKGGYYEFEVSFSPVESKIYSANMRIENNDPDIPVYFIELYGSSVFPEMYVHSHSLDFEEVAVLSSKDLTLKIENEGSDILKITEFLKSDEIDTIVTISPSNYEIYPNDDKNFKITFSPSEPVYYQGQIYIINNDKTDTVNITGTGFDNTPPEIAFEPENIENSGIQENTAITISAGIEDNNQISWARLLYRQGGKAGFDSVAMEISDGVYNAEIPLAYVTRRGVEYYIKAYDGANYQKIPTTAPEIPAIVRIKIPSLPPLTIPASDYQLFSIPSELLERNASGLLEGILGQYDVKNYRLFRWVNGNYVELKDRLDFAFDPGKAYWLITKEQEVISIDTSISVKTNESFIMSLDEGWNQVGIPFYFPVSWQDVYDASPGIVQGSVAYEWDGTGWVTSTRLEPFNGYFIYTPYGGNIIKFPPDEAGQGIAKKSQFANLSEGEWNIRLSIESGNLHDRDNFVGVRYSSDEKWDINDMMDPPNIGNKYVNISFNRKEWEEVSGIYSGDFKEVNLNGHFYDFSVKAKNVSDKILLKFEKENEIPENFELFLIDIDERTGRRIFQLDEIIWENKSNLDKNYRIIVGTKAYIKENNMGVGITPTEFRLAQNYPNPFNPITTIHYDLPEIEEVNLSVYNYLGQCVKTLVNEQKNPGYYQIQWNGLNQKGQRVASGIYFYVIQAGNNRQACKMVMLK